MNLKKGIIFLISFIVIIIGVFFINNVVTYSISLLLFLFVINEIHNLSMNKFLPVMEKNKDLFIMYLIVRSLKIPIKTMLISIFIMIEFDILNTKYSFHASYLETINSIWDYYVVFLVSWILLRFSDRLKFYLIKMNKDKMIRLSDEDDIHGSKYIQTTLDAVFKFINFAIFTAAGLATLQNLGLSLSGLLAFGGFSGIIFGFASKDLFSNIFGGIMIYLNRPFDIDDWVKSPDRDIEGTVEKIGWLVTIIRKLDKRPIYIPNSIFNNIVVENPSRMTHRRIRENFYISVEHLEKIPSISRDIKKMISEHNGIDADELIMVNLEHIDNLYLNMFIYCFTNTVVWSSYHDIKQDLFYKIGEIVKFNECELAVPQQHITLKK